MTAVLVLGDEADPHAEIVATKCRKAGASVFIGTHFSAEQLGTITYANGEAKRTSFAFNAGADQFHSLWNRLKPIGLDGLSEVELFVLRERRDFFMSVIACFLPFERRLNDPWAQDLARMKPFQLWLARR